MALYPPTFQSYIGYRAFIYFTENEVHHQDAIPPRIIQVEMQNNCEIELQDLVSILALIILALSIAACLEHIIKSGLENAEDISA